VISYLTARPSKNIIEAGHQQSTYVFWDDREKFSFFISEIVVDECSAGDPLAAKRRLDVLRDLEMLELTESSVQLAKELIVAGIVPPKAAEDALHISIATIHFMDYLVTWNCRHIANPEMQSQIAEYLRTKGLWLPFICTPDELLGDEL